MRKKSKKEIIIMSARKEAWKQFSNEIQATYIKGGIIKSEKIEATFQNWQIVYDFFSMPIGAVILVYTRIRAPFLTKSDFQFRISKKTFLDKVAEKFGKSDIEIGDSRIDDIFIIESNSTEKVKNLLSDEKIKTLLLEKSDLDFEISHGYKGIGRQFPKNCDGLSLVVLNESKDKETLMLIYTLFGEILTSLLETGDIDDATVDVKL